jgi:hypothetical protein
MMMPWMVTMVKCYVMYDYFDNHEIMVKMNKQGGGVLEVHKWVRLFGQTHLDIAAAPAGCKVTTHVTAVLPDRRIFDRRS